MRKRPRSGRKEPENPKIPPAGRLRRGGRPAGGALSPAGKARRPLTLGESFRERVGDLKARGASPKTLQNLRGFARVLWRVAGLAPTMPLTRITGRAARRIIGKILAHHGPYFGWRLAMELRHHVARVVSAGLLLENPFEGIVPPRPRLLMGPSLSRKEMARLLRAPDLRFSWNIRTRALLENLYSTGLRISECLSLGLEDVDLSAGTVRVLKAKGRRERVVPLGEEAARWIGRYLVKWRAKYAKPGSTHLWITWTGRKLRFATLCRRLRGLAREVGIAKPVSPHTLRRTFASHLLSGGASPWVVKELLGHADSRMLGRYVRVSPKELKDAHEKTHPRG